MANSDTDPRDITTDHETIMEWVEQRGGTPAHRTGQISDDASSLYIVREDEQLDDLESISWDEFFETFEAEGLAFVYQDRDVGASDEWLYDLIDREEVAERATLDRSAVEESLLEGEVVRSEITETKVIEKTVIETDQIESQIVDSEIVESNPVDREVISREIVGVSFEAAPENLTATLGPAPAEHPESTEAGDRSVDATSEHDDSKASPVDEPADKTIPDPPVDRKSPDREEANRTATSEESMKRDATGQQPGDRKAADDHRAADDEHAADRQPTGESSLDDEMTVDQSAEDRPLEESADGLGIGEGVVVDVHDTVRMTTEIFDRKTVESRVVDQEITEADTVASDEVDIEGVEASLLESDLISGEIVSDEPTEDEQVDTGADTRTQVGELPSGAISSERTEGDAIHSQFVERRLVETESTEHHQLTCDISDHRLIDTVDSRSTVIEHAIVDREAGEEAMLREPEAGVQSTDEQLSAANESATPSDTAETATAGADAEMAAEPSGDTGEAGMTDETTFSEDEIGKQVVSGDREIGMVSDVDTDTQTLYVDPEPSLTDKIKATLDLGDIDDESYPVEPDQIEEITDDEVRIQEL